MPKTKRTFRYTKKAPLAVFLAVITLLACSLIFFNFRNAQLSTQRDMQAVLDSAEQNISEAESRNIFGDQPRALDAATTAKGQIQQVADSGLFPDQVKTLMERVDKVYNQLNKITPVNDFQTLGSFSGTPDMLIKIPQGFLGFNSAVNTFEVYDFAGNKLSSVALSSPAPEKLAAGAYFPQSNTAGFIGADGKFYRLDIGMQTLAPFSESTANDIGSPLGLEIYQNKAYTIDTSRSQILRFSASDQSFANPQNWLSENVDLSKARAFAVDGLIWVLLPDQILKFKTGKSQPFSMPVLSKPISDGVRLHTQLDDDNLYILDQASNRLLIITKTGKLSAQLTSERFGDMRDFYADEKNHAIYAVIGQELVKFGF